MERGVFVINKQGLKKAVLEALDKLEGGFDSENLKAVLKEIGENYPTLDRKDLRDKSPVEMVDLPLNPNHRLGKFF